MSAVRLDLRPIRPLRPGAVLAALALLAACSDSSVLDHNRATFPALSPAGDETTPARDHVPADLDALLPSKVRIHPLTRLERAPGNPGESSPWQIACHIELRDAFGHATKGLGRLRVELYRPVGDGAGGPEAQDAVWTIDLRNPRENARVYDDLVTRSYTVYLASLPRWLEEWASQSEQHRANDDSRAAGPVDEGWVTLKAYFISFDRTGRERTYESSFRLMY